MMGSHTAAESLTVPALGESQMELPVLHRINHDLSIRIVHLDAGALPDAKASSPCLKMARADFCDASSQPRMAADGVEKSA